MKGLADVGIVEALEVEVYALNRSDVVWRERMVWIWRKVMEGLAAETRPM